MINNEKVGQRIAMLRKGKGITQEELATRLTVTGQAVSKWEHGNALPDIALLPALARILGTSIDQLLTPYDLFVLEAKYGANGMFADVALALNHQVGDCGLCLGIDNANLSADPAPGLYKYLIVRYLNPNGDYYTFAGEGDTLHIPPGAIGLPVLYQPGESGDFQILSAHYGCEWLRNNVTTRLSQRLAPGGLIPVNHEWFPSPPSIDVPEYLSVLYRNRDGFFVINIQEGSAIAVSSDGRFLVETREQKQVIRHNRIHGVNKLAWGQGQDCTYAGALTAALHALGEDISYETVMGLSGACWRLAFCASQWEYSSVDGLVVYDHATPLAKALGYEFRLIDRVEKKDRENVRAEIVASIDRGAPVAAIDLRVEAEWGVITGYTENGKTLLCRTYFDEGANDYLQVEKWPFILLFIGSKGAPASPRENLLRSLAIFTDEMNITQERGYHMGYNAYHTWCSRLEELADSTSDEALKEPMCVNHFLYTALVDARRAGLAYLRACAGLLEGEAALHLEHATEICAQVNARLADGWQWVPNEQQVGDGVGDDKVGGDSGDGSVAAAWTPEKRRQQAALLRRVCELEQQMEAEFHAILTAA